MSFLFPFLTNITIFASFHVLGMRLSVMHFGTALLVLSQWFHLLLSVFYGSLRLGNRGANGRPRSISAGDGSLASIGVARMFRRASIMLLDFFSDL